MPWQPSQPGAMHAAIPWKLGIRGTPAVPTFADKTFGPGLNVKKYSTKLGIFD